MFNRSKSSFRRDPAGGAEGAGLAAHPLVVPRLWAVLLALAVPFFSASASWFETLERTGRGGAFVADTLFSATIAGYLALVIILKQRRL